MRKVALCRGYLEVGGCSLFVDEIPRTKGQRQPAFDFVSVVGKD